MSDFETIDTPAYAEHELVNVDDKKYFSAINIYLDFFDELAKFHKNKDGVNPKGKYVAEARRNPDTEKMSVYSNINDAWFTDPQFVAGFIVGVEYDRKNN